MRPAGLSRFRTVTCFAFLAIAAMIAPFAHAAQGVDEAMAGIRSPEDIVRFFSREFSYMMVLPDRAHSPDETIAAHSGDCEDFAVLASAMLSRMGIENQTLVLRFKGLNIAHAICIWKGADGLYNFISNRELQRTGQRTVEGAIRKFYPDLETIASIDPQARLGGGNSSSGVSSAKSAKPAKSYRGAVLMTNLDPRISAAL